MHLKKRRRILKKTKGFTLGRKKIFKLANIASVKAGVRAFRGRKLKKRDARGEWQVKINAGLEELGMSYSKFMGKLKKANITLNRKILAQLAAENPQAFKKLVEKIK